MKFLTPDAAIILLTKSDTYGIAFSLPKKKTTEIKINEGWET
jgi:hypothetical protein